MRAGDEQGDEKVQERNQEVTCQYDNGLAIRQKRRIQAKEASLIQTLRIRRLCSIKKIVVLTMMIGLKTVKMTGVESKLGIQVTKFYMIHSSIHVKSVLRYFLQLCGATTPRIGECFFSSDAGVGSWPENSFPGTADMLVQTSYLHVTFLQRG
jgi:hypothetical protein